MRLPIDRSISASVFRWTPRKFNSEKMKSED